MSRRSWPTRPTRPRSARGARPVIATGLGASPGLVSGAIATSAEAAVRMADQGTAVLLVRSETSPDDVHGMARAVGILTATGGLASHAAVVARGWDIPAVVGAAGVVVHDGLVEIAGTTYREGEVLSIDGSSGEVFARRRGRGHAPSCRRLRSCSPGRTSWGSPSGRGRRSGRCLRRIHPRGVRRSHVTTSSAPSPSRAT